MIGRVARVGTLIRGCRLGARVLGTVTIATLALVATGVMAPQVARAHDVPNEIIIRGFAKPDGNRLNVAVRVPLILLSQLDLPKRGPGYLDLAQIDPSLDQAAARVAFELVRFSEGDEHLSPVAIDHRISLPSEDAFDTYDQALNHIQSRDLPESTDVFWNQGFFDAYLTFSIESEKADLYVDPIPPSGVGDKMEVILQFVSPDGPVRTYRLAGDADAVALDPSWFYAARTFVESGIAHILSGIDHLLFLLCLVLPLRSLRRLLPVVTSFTVAHSIALIASAQGLVPSAGWFPPLVEAMIAASIVYMAVENVIAPDLRRRWIITGIFGVVHGFGFSYGLQQEFQLAGDHLLASLFSFNLGVEIGQVIVLTIAVPVLALLFRVPTLSRFGVAIASILIGHVGWHWMTDRVAVLQSVEWPALTGPTVVVLARGLVALMLIGAALHVLARRRQRSADERALEEGKTEPQPEPSSNGSSRPEAPLRRERLAGPR
jgi:hypothetical protein